MALILIPSKHARETTMTHLEAGNARRAEAEAAMASGNYAEAARCYVWAAEQFENSWYEMHRHQGKSPDATMMRQSAAKAIRARNAENTAAA